MIGQVHFGLILNYFFIWLDAGENLWCLQMQDLHWQFPDLLSFIHSFQPQTVAPVHLFHRVLHLQDILAADVNAHFRIMWHSTAASTSKYLTLTYKADVKAPNPTVVCNESYSLVRESQTAARDGLIVELIIPLTMRVHLPSQVS